MGVRRFVFLKNIINHVWSARELHQSVLIVVFPVVVFVKADFVKLLKIFTNHIEVLEFLYKLVTKIGLALLAR